MNEPGGLLRLDPEVARQVAAEHGTPVYVQDLALVRQRYRALEAALPPFVDILYAMKANPHPKLVTALLAEGAGLEVASGGELATALACGAEAERLAFAGPAKRDSELTRALELGLLLNVESLGELERAERIAAERGLRRRVSVRISPPWSAGETVSIIGGAEPSKFGVDLDQVEGFLARAAQLQHVSVTGIHVFNATNVLDAAALAAGWARVLDLAIELRDAGRIALGTIDVGGGLGVPYAAGVAPLDVGALGRAFADACTQRFGNRPPRIVVEPGRHLVAEAGTFLTRVIDRKSCRGREIVLCDGGINHLLRPALIGQGHPMGVVGREAAVSDGDYDVAGPLCTSLDYLAKQARLPDPRPGDLIGIGCAGAYGYTESMLEFLSHPRPAQVMLG